MYREAGQEEGEEMTLIVVCVLAAGMSLTPPTGWTIEKIEHHGETWYMEYTDKAHTKVTLKRSVKEGDSATIPDGCQGEATVQTPRSATK